MHHLHAIRLVLSAQGGAAPHDRPPPPEISDSWRQAGLAAEALHAPPHRGRPLSHGRVGEPLAG